MKDYAAELALFLLEETGSIFGHWSGRMPAEKQRELFGRYLGKGEINIDGNEEEVWMTVSTCYGQLRERAFQFSWASLMNNQ